MDSRRLKPSLRAKAHATNKLVVTWRGLQPAATTSVGVVGPEVLEVLNDYHED